jgi:hypothetical protein
MLSRAPARRRCDGPPLKGSVCALMKRFICAGCRGNLCLLHVLIPIHQLLFCALPVRVANGGPFLFCSGGSLLSKYLRSRNICAGAEKGQAKPPPRRDAFRRFNKQNIDSVRAHYLGERAKKFFLSLCFRLKCIQSANHVEEQQGASPSINKNVGLE